MTCVRFPGGILCLANESEPFFYRGKRFVMNEQFGPIAVNRHGDPLDAQPSGRVLQDAYEHWLAVYQQERGRYADTR